MYRIACQDWRQSYLWHGGVREACSQIRGGDDLSENKQAGNYDAHSFCDCADRSDCAAFSLIRIGAFDADLNEDGQMEKIVIVQSVLHSGRSVLKL